MTHFQQLGEEWTEKIFREISGSDNQPQDHCDREYDKEWWYDSKEKWPTTSILAVLTDTQIVRICIKKIYSENNHKSKKLMSPLSPGTEEHVQFDTK